MRSTSPARSVEDHIRDLVCGMLADPETRAALAALSSSGNGTANGSSLVEDLRTVEAKRQRLVDLYTDGDIDHTTFRSRRDALDKQVRALEAEMAQRSGSRVLVDLPTTLDGLVDAWETRGVEFQRRLADALLHPIVVKPAGTRRRCSIPDRLVIEPRA